MRRTLVERADKEVSMQLFCPQCRLEQPKSHAYCLRCGHELPRHLLGEEPAKTTRYFAGVKVGRGDPDHAYLRVSCYRKDQLFESPEGSVTIPGHHVRFSVWVSDEARCVMSLPETEAVALAAYIREELGQLAASGSEGQSV